VHSEIVSLTPLAALGIGGNNSPTAVIAEAQQSIKPEAIALGAFGAISGLAALLIAGQVIGRVLRRGTTQARTLRSLGADRAMTQSDALVGLSISVLLGSLLAAAVAVALSPLMPIGPVRPVYPYRGLSFDWTVLGLGLLALLVTIGSLVVTLARREVSRLSSNAGDDIRRAEPAIVRAAENSTLPVSMVTGLRFALDPGRGRGDVPVRSAILGAVLAVAVVVTTVTFGASLDSLVSHPALYGWNWNYAMLSGFSGQEDLPGPQTAKLLNDDRAVAAWSGANFIAAKLDGQELQMITERPGAPVQPPVLSGHGLQGANQVVLGAETLDTLHKHLGDTVTLSEEKSKPLHLLIVGTATMPTITKGMEMGSGALVATSDFPVAVLNAQENSIPGPQAVMVRTRAGTSSAEALQSLHTIVNKINAIPNDGGSAGGVVNVLRPAEIVNYRSMGTTPAILGGGLAAGAVVALGLTLIASVRRRRHELAILKTLGFTQRQLSAAVAWQSSVAVVIGVVIGVPVGIILGRSLWTLFARGIDAVPQPSVPALTIVLIGVGSLLLANLVALVPGRYAASTPTVLVLRTE
jgi:MacB-like periplasmic core domain/FtsX-like permease family